MKNYFINTWTVAFASFLIAFSLTVLTCSGRSPIKRIVLGIKTDHYVKKALKSFEKLRKDIIKRFNSEVVKIQGNIIGVDDTIEAIYKNLYNDGKYSEKAISVFMNDLIKSTTKEKDEIFDSLEKTRDEICQSANEQWEKVCKVVDAANEIFGYERYKYPKKFTPLASRKAMESYNC